MHTVRCNLRVSEYLSDSFDKTFLCKLFGREIYTHRKGLICFYYRLPFLKLLACFLQDLHSQRHYQPRFFGERNKVVGQYKAACWMFPPGEGLKTRDRAVVKRNYRLVKRT